MASAIVRPPRASCQLFVGSCEVIDESERQGKKDCLPPGWRRARTAQAVCSVRARARQSRTYRRLFCVVKAGTSLAERVSQEETTMSHWSKARAGLAVQPKSHAGRSPIEPEEAAITQPFATRGSLEHGQSAERAADFARCETDCRAGGWRSLFPHGVSRHADRIYSPD
jgi:hypothetical protein